MNRLQAYPAEARRIPMADQVEFDALTRFHHMIHCKPGERKRVKRKYHRRWRKQIRQWVQSHQRSDSP